MSELHAFGPQLEVFNGQELHTSQEQRVAALYFRSIAVDAQLTHIERLHFQNTEVQNLSNEPEGEYTQEQLLLERVDVPESTLNLNGGRLEIAIQTTVADNPATIEEMPAVVVGVAYIDANETRGAQVIYRLGSDGVIRREDVAPSPFANEEAEAITNMDAINNAATEEEANRAWELEIARQVHAARNHNNNEALEAVLKLNRQPVGKGELEWLDEVIRYAQ